VMLRFGGVERSGGPNFWIFTLCGAKKSERVRVSHPTSKPPKQASPLDGVNAGRFGSSTNGIVSFYQYSAIFFRIYFRHSLRQTAQGPLPTASSDRFTSRNQNDRTNKKADNSPIYSINTRHPILL